MWADCCIFADNQGESVEALCPPALKIKENYLYRQLSPARTS